MQGVTWAKYKNSSVAQTGPYNWLREEIEQRQQHFIHKATLLLRSEYTKTIPRTSPHLSSAYSSRK